MDFSSVILGSRRKSVRIVAKVAVMTKNRIDASSPYISPITPNMNGDKAPGNAPIENNNPNARPGDFLGLTSVNQAENAGTAKKKKKPMKTRIRINHISAKAKLRMNRQGATNAMDMIMNGSRLCILSERYKEIISPTTPAVNIIVLRELAQTGSKPYTSTK